MWQIKLLTNLTAILLFIFLFIINITKVDAKFIVNSLEYKIDTDKSTVSKITLHVVNEEKVKTLKDVQIDLKSNVTDLKASEGDKELPIEIIGNILKINFSVPLKPLESKDIFITYKTSEYFSTIGNLSRINIPQFPSEIAPKNSTLEIPLEFGPLNFGMCDCTTIPSEDKLILTGDNFSHLEFGDHQTFSYKFIKLEPLQSDLNVNLVKPDMTNSIFYKNYIESSPTSTFIDDVGNLIAKYNKSQIVKLDSTVIIYQNHNPSLADSIRDSYDQFMIEIADFCKDKTVEICSSAFISGKLVDRLTEKNILSEVIVGFQYDQFKSTNSLHAWVKAKNNGEFIYIDPFLELLTGFNYLDQIDIQRFPIYILSKNNSKSNFLNNVNIPNEVTISPITEERLVNSSEELVFSLDTTSYNQIKKYSVETSNPTNQIVLIRNLTFETEMIKFSENSEIPIFPGKQILIPIDGDVEGYIKNSDLILTLQTFQNKIWKKQIVTLVNYGKLLQTDLINQITIGGYIVIITIAIFFTLRIIFAKKQD